MDPLDTRISLLLDFDLLLPVLCLTDLWGQAGARGPVRKSPMEPAAYGDMWALAGT